MKKIFYLALVCLLHVSLYGQNDSSFDDDSMIDVDQSSDEVLESMTRIVNDRDIGFDCHSFRNPYKHTTIKDVPVGSIHRALSGDFLSNRRSNCASEFFLTEGISNVELDEIKLLGIDSAYAIEITKKLEKIEEHVREGCDVSALDSKGRTLLHEAALRKNNNAIGALVSQGLDVDGLSDENETPLFEVLKISKKLHRSGIVKEYDADGYFMELVSIRNSLNAIQDRMIETIKCLLNYRADISVRDIKGYSLLHRAIDLCFDKVALYLDPLLADDMLALQFALDEGNYEIAFLMRKVLREQKSEALYRANQILNESSSFKHYALLRYYKDLCAEAKPVEVIMSGSFTDHKDDELLADEFGLPSDFRDTITCKEFLRSEE